MSFNLERSLDSVGELICTCDDNYVYQYCNDNYASLFGRTPKDVVGFSVSEIYPDFVKSVFFQAITETIKTGNSNSRVGYSDYLNSWLVIRNFKLSENLNMMLAHKISNSTKKSGYLANIDGLTSLQSRVSFEEDVQQLYFGKSEFSIILIDLLKFKAINETFGFHNGDRCLMETAAYLKKSLSKDAKVYRFNPNQFSIILNTTSIVVIKEEMNKILEVFKKAFVFNEHSIEIDIALTYYQFNNFTLNLEEIISNLELSIEKAKKQKNVPLLCSNNKENKLHNIKNKILIANDIKRAMKDKELFLNYQPQYDIKTKKICGAEALVRWKHPTRGLIMPGQFLPVAEDFDLMGELDRYVLFRVFRDILHFQKSGFNFPISVNLSSKSICDPQIMNFYTTLLEKSSVNPNLVTIEITENAFIEDESVSREVVQTIVNSKSSVAIDDFGTGYSSLSYLMRYPSKYLKIDRGFITNIDKEEAKQHIVSNLVKMSHSLGIKVVAEGVEFKDELEIVQDLKCDIVQGYIFGKPMPIDELFNKIKTQGFSDAKIRERD